MGVSGSGSAPNDKKLADAEQKLFTAAFNGTFANLRTETASDDDPCQGESWGASRQISASLLIKLLTETHSGNKPPRAVKLRGARITGLLDLEASAIACPLYLRDCYFDEGVNLDEATAPSIRIVHCCLPALTARQLRTMDDLRLDDTTFSADRVVTLRGAHIGGMLVMSGASLTNPGGRALDADHITVGGIMAFEEFTANGEVHLAGARIGGELNMSGASLANPGGRALDADHITVGGSMRCIDGFTANGAVSLVAGRIGGQLVLAPASLANPGGQALIADSLAVNLDMLCVQFTASGEISLPGAHIGGQLQMRRASLANPGGQALNADHISIEQSMLCIDRFTAEGEISLHRGRIGGLLDMSGASLTNPGGQALNAEDVSIEHSMYCRDEFTADGEVFMSGAHIGGTFDTTGASLTNPDKWALTLYGADITELRLWPRQPPDGVVSLANGKVGRFYDDRASWPAVLDLAGFAYETLSSEGISARHRLQWLARHRDGYVPQLYDQLASTYRRAGDEQAARKVAIAKQRRKRSVLSPLSWLWYLTVAYGYRPWLAGAWVIALAALGTVVFSHGYPAHMMATSTHPPAFHPAAYTLDLLLPVIGLGQKSAWQPQESTYQYWSWGFTGAGWVLTTAVIAGLTGILKRD
jgi:hypothetical protein